MAEHIKLNAFSINKIIDLIKGQNHGTVAYTLNAAETEVRIEGKFSDEYVGTCTQAAANKIQCSAQLKVHVMKAGCDSGFSSDPEVVETKEIIFDDVTTPDALVGTADARTDGGLSDAAQPRADMSTAADAQVSADGQVANDMSVVPADTSVASDGAVQPNEDMGVAADGAAQPDAAPVEPDVAPPPPLDLESITFGIEPGTDCLLLPEPGPISSCMDIASVQAFDVSRLFTSDAQPIAQVIEDVQLRIDDDDNNPNNANQNYPRNISFIDRADRQRYIRFVPVDVGQDYGLWDIEVHDESIQHPEENTIDTPGNIRASLERCVNGDCNLYSHTVHITVNGIINGALTSCSWQYPKPEGSLCGR